MADWLKFGAAFLVGSGFGPFVVWLLKRSVQRRRKVESLDIDERTLKLLGEYFVAQEQAKEHGIELRPPESLKEMGLQRSSLEKRIHQQDELIRYLNQGALNAISWGIKEVYTRALLVEGLVGRHPEERDAVELVRQAFVSQFRDILDNTPQAIEQIPELSRSLMHSYYSWILDPNEANTEAFHFAARQLTKAISDGRLEVRGHY